jgi:plastocyanin
MIKIFTTVLCFVAVMATACGQSSTQEETTSATATATGSKTPSAEATTTQAPAATITIASMKFGEPVTVSPGAQVAIKNDDSAEHSVTSQTAGVFDVHVDGHDQGMLTAPAQPGEYAFYCVYHPSMKGTLIVK